MKNFKIIYAIDDYLGCEWNGEVGMISEFLIKKYAPEIN
jgi:hypothetical protein